MLIKSNLCLMVQLFASPSLNCFSCEPGKSIWIEIPKGFPWKNNSNEFLSFGIVRAPQLRRSASIDGCRLFDTFTDWTGCSGPPRLSGRRWVIFLLLKFSIFHRNLGVLHIYRQLLCGLWWGNWRVVAISWSGKDFEYSWDTQLLCLLDFSVFLYNSVLTH